MNRRTWRLRACGVLLALAFFSFRSHGETVLEPVIKQVPGGVQVSFRSNEEVLSGVAAESSAGLEVQFPGGAWHGVIFPSFAKDDKGWLLGPAKVGLLTITLTVSQRAPNLIERAVRVDATERTGFRLRFSMAPSGDGMYCSWLHDEKDPVVYGIQAGGPEHANERGQTFPVAMWWDHRRVLGVLADSPGMWENRCTTEIDPRDRRLAVTTGDGSAEHEVRIVNDANGAYTCRVDGWQIAGPDHTARFSTWVFLDAAKSRYDTRVAAHLAMANAKGWNASALEAILRNTSYLLLRRNLMRTESRYIFISGIGYGWKQWGTDAFYMAIGLNDPKMLEESYRGLFDKRLMYEDNAQYYLIWSALVRREGGQLNDPLVRQAYKFIREHEKDGLYVPPPLKGAAKPKGFKTYHDLLEYDDDDSPTSNQGFHCGALIAAKELGLSATDADIDRAIAAYQSLFNAERGFFPTSRKQHDTLGQDTLYGETLTYAVFGRKLLTDEQVLKHLEYTFRVMSPYGMRVISKADGALLPGHSGSYVFGGSWFMCDHAALLSGLIHGMPSDQIDRRLIDRIGLEINHYPAFNESISTVDGQPHGHILYSANSGYAWIRREIRRRLNMVGPDPVEVSIDKRLGVIRTAGFLRLEGIEQETRGVGRTGERAPGAEAGN